MMFNTRASRLIGMVLALAVYGGAARAADTAKDLVALESVDQNWAKAYNAQNVDALAKSYDEHAVLLPPGAPAANGRAAIRAFLAKDTSESAKAGAVLALTGKPAGGVSGDMGWQSGSYVVKDKAGKVVDTGKYLSVSMKKNGQWLYVRDTWNSDGAPAPAAAPAANSAPAKKQ